MDLDERKKELEIAKLEQEVAAAAAGRSWWRKSFRETKVTDWLAVAVGVTALFAAWFTGFFNATKERLEVEKIHLEQRKEKLTVEVAAKEQEITSKERELNDVKKRLEPIESEDVAIQELRSLGTKQLAVRFAIPDNFQGVQVTIRGTDESGTRAYGWREASGAFVWGPPICRTNEHLTSALKAANRLRSLKSLTLKELRVTASELVIAGQHPDLVSLAINDSEMDESTVAALRPGKNLQRLDLSSNRIRSFAGVPSSSSISYLVLRDNPIGDDGLQSLLKAFPNLKGLMLSGTTITDEGMKALSKVEEFWHIDITDTKVTDAGVQELLKCKKVHNLRVNRSQITLKTAELFDNKWKDTISLIDKEKAKADDN